MLRQTQSAPAPAIPTPAVADDAVEAAIDCRQLVAIENVLITYLHEDGLPLHKVLNSPKSFNAFEIGSTVLIACTYATEYSDKRETPSRSYYRPSALAISSALRSKENIFLPARVCLVDIDGSDVVAF